MEVLFFRIGSVLCGLPTDQVVSLEKSEQGEDLGKLLGHTASVSHGHGRCVRLRGDGNKRFRIDDVVGIQTVQTETVSPLPSLLRKKLKTSVITGVVWHREEGALLLDLTHATP